MFSICCAAAEDDHTIATAKLRQTIHDFIARLHRKK